jgi:hypothetical protein
VEAVKVRLIPARAVRTVAEVALLARGSRFTGAALTSSLTSLVDGRARTGGRARAVVAAVGLLGPAVGWVGASTVLALSVLPVLFLVVRRAMIGRPVTVEVVVFAAAVPVFPLSPTLVASLFVNSPRAARFLVTSCLPTVPPTTRPVGLVGSAVLAAVVFLPRMVEAVEVVLLMAGLMGAVEVEVGLMANVPERERVVGAFSSVRVVRVEGARVRRVCDTATLM